MSARVYEDVVSKMHGDAGFRSRMESNARGTAGELGCHMSEEEWTSLSAELMDEVVEGRSSKVCLDCGCGGGAAC